MVATTIGAMIGLLSGATGWAFGCAEVAGPGPLALLLGGSMAVGAAAGVALFAATGLIGSVRGSLLERNAGFSPNFPAVTAALVGSAAGFWWRFETGDAGLIAVWSAGGGLVFGVAAYVLEWLAGTVLDLSDPAENT